MSGITLAGGPPGGNLEMGEGGARKIKLKNDATNLFRLGGKSLFSSVKLTKQTQGKVFSSDMAPLSSLDIDSGNQLVRCQSGALM